MDYRIPIAEDYLKVLGRAIYNFAYYEAVVLNVMQNIDSRYVNKTVKKGKATSGEVADQFLKMVRKFSMEDVNLKDRLHQSASDFLLHVDERNKLVHARPYTASSGEQQLLYWMYIENIEWDKADVEEAARAFDGAAASLLELRDTIWPPAPPAPSVA